MAPWCCWLRRRTYLPYGLNYSVTIRFLNRKVLWPQLPSDCNHCLNSRMSRMARIGTVMMPMSPKLFTVTTPHKDHITARPAFTHILIPVPTCSRYDCSIWENDYQFDIINVLTCQPKSAPLKNLTVHSILVVIIYIIYSGNSEEL